MSRIFQTTRCPLLRWALLYAMVCGLTGCSGDTEKTYPVAGRVVWTDGEPATELAGGTVELQLIDAAARSVNPNGEIQSDGTFALRSYQREDGAPAGKYRALVFPRKSMGIAGPDDVYIMDRRFENYTTSELEVAIEPQDNQIILKVHRAK